MNGPRPRPAKMPVWERADSVEPVPMPHASQPPGPPPARMPTYERDLAHMVGDARKRLLEQQPNHDEVHAHEDVDWNLVRGED